MVKMGEARVLPHWMCEKKIEGDMPVMKGHTAWYSAGFLNLSTIDIMG